ncbi:hypothetical protein HGRIS_002545 [Hohenbuehelia grisea]|uniref:Alpha/beta hydrolase fold-3 domain-containing protein n=1 Tax=Hohenbuehelia grisea TaxID=104357 RepID=A0ABR3JLY5_9AGAR
MIDHLAGRPNPSWKRTQVFLVILFWVWRILRGNPGGPRILFLRRANRLLQRFTPWQIVVSTLTAVYTIRNFDKILGLGSPEPLANLYSPSFYRATWITVGLDAGFATAMSIRPKWLKDICSILFSVYYIVYAHEADEKLRKYRAVPTVEMLRSTWEKTTHPFVSANQILNTHYLVKLFQIRTFLRLPPIAIRRKILLPRPKGSAYQRPITAYLFFALPEKRLCKTSDLILDYPGGGFIAMSPEHHEERLRGWAISTGKPVLSIDYGKAPEYPYPFAIDEAFDVYKLLVECGGSLIGMSGKKLRVVMSGDSAGATIAVNAVFRTIEDNMTNIPALPLPVAVVLNYAALDFNFTSWMTNDHLRVLRAEQSSGNLPGLRELAARKDHLQHVSPLSMDKPTSTHSRGKGIRRKKSWKDTLRGFTTGSDKDGDDEDTGLNTAKAQRSRTLSALKSPHGPYARRRHSALTLEDQGSLADGESDEEIADVHQLKEEDRPIAARVRYRAGEANSARPDQAALAKQQEELSAAVAAADAKAQGFSQSAASKGKAREPIGTRLTMTSRTGYFQDRIISPSMMRAMAILYIGPYRNPDFSTDYHISPILAPSHILAQFPPVLMQCGEKDPFVDDTVIFAGRVREAKRARKAELDLAISGKSARFGESLRMSASLSGSHSGDTARLAALKRERDRLAKESEDDWVEMVIFSDWSHGYLQMPSLMHEAKAVIEELADWIDDAFRRHTGVEELEGAGRLVVLTEDAPQTSSDAGPGTASETETEDAITFIPKKYQQEAARTIVASPLPLGTDGSWGSTVAGDSRLGDVSDMDGPSAGKQQGTRQAGQIISETELLRRRRLLDAHIFD